MSFVDLSLQCVYCHDYVGKTNDTIIHCGCYPEYKMYDIAPDTSLTLSNSETQYYILATSDYTKKSVLLWCPHIFICDDNNERLLSILKYYGYTDLVVLIEERTRSELNQKMDNIQNKIYDIEDELLEINKSLSNLGDVFNDIINLVKNSQS